MKKLIFNKQWMRISVLPVAISFALLLFSGCSSKKGNGNGSKTTEQSSFRPDTATVKTTEVQARDFSRSLQSTGTLVARRHAELRTLVSGKITNVKVDIGDHVKKGAVLLQIRKVDYKLALEQAEANLTRTKASLDNAKQNYDRMKNLYQAGSATAQQYDQAQAGYDEARAALKQAQAARDNAQQRLDDTTIRAPYNGFITHRYMMEGEYANVAQPAFDITDLSVLEAEMDLPEEYAGSIPVGLKVKISFLSGFEPVEGVVTRVNPSIDISTRTFKIKIRVDNSNFKLPDGLFCTGVFNLPEMKNKPAVPKEALDEHEGQAIVWIIKDGKAHMQDVTEGPTSGDWVMIEKGLNIGENVAVTGTSILIDGYPVKVQNN